MDAQPLLTIPNASEYLLSSFKQFQAIVGDEAQARRFFAIAMNVVEQVPKVLQCSRSSFRNALIEAARLDLEPNSVQQLCWIIPRGKEARLEMGYRGLVQLVLRDGGVKSVWSNLVYNGEDFDYDGGTNKIQHCPFALIETPLDEMVAAYACAKLHSGEVQNAIMPRAQLEAARKMSKSTAYDGPFASEMYKKTPLKRLCKTLPLRSPDVARAAWIEDEKEGVVPDPEPAQERTVFEFNTAAVDTNEEAEARGEEVVVIDASEETREEVNDRISRTWKRLEELDALPELTKPENWGYDIRWRYYQSEKCGDDEALEFANFLTRCMLEAEREQRS